MSNHKTRWAWRDYLTPEEREKVNEANDAKRRWQELRVERRLIQNRATCRAKYAALTASEPTPEDAALSPAAPVREGGEM